MSQIRTQRLRAVLGPSIRSSENDIIDAIGRETVRLELPVAGRKLKPDTLRGAPRLEDEGPRRGLGAGPGRRTRHSVDGPIAAIKTRHGSAERR